MCCGLHHLVCYNSYFADPIEAKGREREEMIRCTIEMVPLGDESRKRTIGLIEIANDATGSAERGNYVVVLKKTPPWHGALNDTWRKAKLQDDCGEEVLTGKIEGLHRSKRGVYDLLYRALKACVGGRN